MVYKNFTLGWPRFACGMLYNATILHNFQCEAAAFAFIHCGLLLFCHLQFIAYCRRSVAL